MIPKHITDKIIEASSGELQKIVEQFIDLKPSGSNMIGLCPSCGKKKFTVTGKKDIWKCFSCNIGGKGAASFLQDVHQMTFPEALKYLAEVFHIQIEDTVKQKAYSKRKTFRDIQLVQSGLEEADQRFNVVLDSQTTKEINRYESATLDRHGNVVPGDDMVMHYITLDGGYASFQTQAKGKDRKLQRVRWQIPENHLDKHGTPIKYQSPYGSGSHLWITNPLYKKFQRRSPIKRLFIQEGEKKADKASKHGMISVGIMGINNLSQDNSMPHDFQRILNTCQIEQVIFVLDSDFQDLSQNTEKPVESRPRQFLAAVRKFKDYFYEFQQHGIKVDTYLANIKPNKPGIKGIDDLLVHLKAGELFNSGEKEILEEFNEAMFKSEFYGEHIDCIKITAHSESQLRKIFHMQTREEFFEFHIEELQRRPYFTYGKIKWRYNAETKNFELDQPLLPDEEYWTDDSYQTNTGRTVHKLQFNYANCYHFLRNRGFGRYGIPGNSKYRFVQLEKNIIQELEPFQIKDYLIEFTEGIGEKLVLELLYRGAKMYLGPDSLSNLKYIQTEFHQSNKGVQFMYFRNKYWKITDEGIFEKPLEELDKTVWSDSLVDFDASWEGSLVSVIPIDAEFISRFDKDSRNVWAKTMGNYFVEISDQAADCDFFRYLFNASNFFFDKKLQKKSQKEPFQILSGASYQDDVFRQVEVYQHLLSKLTAIGYLLHDYKDSSVLKAVVAMDGKLSEVGQSNGRTGKSILGDALEKILPTVTIPGKRNKLTEDDFLFSKVDERTRLVFIDDARTNLDFEFFFPMITGRLDVNRKGKDAFSLTGNDVPKLLITTNHALNGNGSSFKDRQHLIAYSDWYSDQHKPIDDFGRLFFDEWDRDQWNKFYCLMAECLMLYFRYGLVPAPDERLEKRRLRQMIGESVIDWAETYYEPDGSNLNQKQARHDVYKNFIDAYPKQRRYIDNISFKRRLMNYCVYSGLEFNPGYPGKNSNNSGGDLKQGGVEYFIIANENYDPSGFNLADDTH